MEGGLGWRGVEMWGSGESGGLVIWFQPLAGGCGVVIGWRQEISVGMEITRLRVVFICDTFLVCCLFSSTELGMALGEQPDFFFPWNRTIGREEGR